MKRAMFSLLLGLLSLGLFFTSVALAAPSQPLALPAEPVALFQGTITPTTDITSTTSHTHPVAAAIAEYFSEDFGVSYLDVMGLHEEGYGFGVIAHAYFAARKLGMDPQTLLDQFDAGMGWGEILKDYGLHPGQAGRGGNLGDIMSGNKKGQSLDGVGRTPPGQLKKGSGQSGDDDKDNGGRGKGKGRDK